ncbi:protein of unknown function [Lachnospiraceae bacterium]|nr:protein of unknown function [Lachnospiraceae bacterium]
MTKQQIRNMIILLVVLVVLVGGYFGMKSFREADDAAMEASTEADIESVNIGALSGNGICKLSWKYEGKDVSIEKKDGVWYYGSVSLNSVTMSSKTSDLELMTAKRTLTGDEVDLSAFGLDDPANVITAADADGKTQKIVVGAKNDVTGDYYVYLDDDSSKVYVTASSVPTDFEADPETLAAETSDSGE